MIYLYDQAICKDLIKSFNPNNAVNPVVRVADPEESVDLAAQIDNDEVKFPLVSLKRDADNGIDKERTNFTRMHRGVQSVLDPNTNLLYYEKVIPIKLSYKLRVVTTNTADMDELLRELMFKYVQMYFLTIQLPYECNRKVRFGVVIDTDQEIEHVSGHFDYISSGKLYESILPLKCEGCVLVSYTPAKLTRTILDGEPQLADQHNK